MPTYNYPFSGGLISIAPFGDKWKIGFTGTWLFGEYWSVPFASDVGDFTLGVGNLHALTPTVCATVRRRVYLGMGSQVNFSDNDNPTGWEEQNPGAGFLLYLSNFGSQDTVAALGQLQGRLVILARRSIQIFTVDADPSNFAWVQTLDNIGTQAPLSVQQLGDYDLIFLDDTGFRSLRTREVTLNSYVDDSGSAIDSFVQTDLLTVAASSARGIVEPTTKNYWCYLNGKIYVFGRHPSAKISAWSYYLPTDQNGATFTPSKFVVLNGQIYCRGVEQGLYRYGGSDNTTYDANTVVTIQTPWLNDKKPDTLKLGTAVEMVSQGKWQLQISMDPQSNNFVTCVPSRGSATSPATLTDSTYDLGNYRVPGLKGTHFSVLLTTTPGAAKQPAVLSALTFHYNDAGKS